MCAYCGAIPSTRDHVPSRVLLDEPYPENLPVVPSCGDCNNKFSNDEQYFACFIECVTEDSQELASIKRDKIKRILSNNPALASKLFSCRYIHTDGKVYWRPEIDRIQNIVLKLARGHVAYELNENKLEQPRFISIIPTSELSQEQFQKFNTPPAEDILPELGSRAFSEIFVLNNEIFNLGNGWKNVQKDRYRYLVSYSYEVFVRIMINEFFACEVIW